MPAPRQTSVNSKLRGPAASLADARQRSTQAIKVEWCRRRTGTFTNPSLASGPDVIASGELGGRRMMTVGERQGGRSSFHLPGSDDPNRAGQ